MCPESGFHIAPKLVINQKNDYGVTVCRHDVIVKFFDIVLFFLSSLVTGLSFMSTLLLLLELWQFLFTRDWPEIWKLEIPPSDFCPIYRDWGKQGTPNLAQTSLMKCYWMLQNGRVCSFYCFWVIKGKPTLVDLTPLPPLSPPRLGLKVMITTP